MDMNYWRIDCIGEEGYSFSVCSLENYKESEIVDLCLQNELLDNDDLDDYLLITQDITNDLFELEHWKSLAKQI